MWRDGKKGFCLAFGVSSVCYGYIFASAGLVYFTDIAIMMVMCILCNKYAKEDRKIEDYIFLFLCAGILNAYAGYWAFSLITLTFSLTVYVYTHIDVKIGILFKRGLELSCSWAAGLGGMIALKQLLVKLFFGSETGGEHLAQWTGLNDGLNIGIRIQSVVQGLKTEMGFIGGKAIIIIDIIMFIICILTKNYRFQRISLKLLPLILFPMIWWFVLYVHCGHGFVHYMYGAWCALLAVIFYGMDEHLV